MTAKNCAEYQQFLSYMYILIVFIFKLIPCMQPTIFKYIIVFFGFRNPESMHARQALSCSLGMQKKPFVSTI